MWHFVHLGEDLDKQNQLILLCPDKIERYYRVSFTMRVEPIWANAFKTIQEKVD